MELVGANKWKSPSSVHPELFGFTPNNTSRRPSSRHAVVLKSRALVAFGINPHHRVVMVGGEWGEPRSTALA